MIMKKLLIAVLALLTVLALSLPALAAAPLQIGVPDDATNQARAIKLLESAGLIEVDPAVGFNAEIKDIIKYIYNIEVTPVSANMLTSTLEDFAASTINGTYAAPYGLRPSRDALLIEKQEEGVENPYVNVIVARTADKDNEIYKTIVAAFQTQIVAEYMIDKYVETYFPAFDYDAENKAYENVVEDIDTYVADKKGKTVVKVGVCGSSNNYWTAVQKVLDEQNAGIYIELVEFDAYTLPNEALNSGEIDLNSFQHKAYLQKEINAQGYDLTVVGDTLIAPLSLYSKKAESLDALKELVGLN